VLKSNNNGYCKKRGKTPTQKNNNLFLPVAELKKRKKYLTAKKYSSIFVQRHVGFLLPMLMSLLLL